MAQSWTTFFHMQPALLWFKSLSFFFKRDIQDNNGQKYPNTESLAASTTSQAEPEAVILDIEAGLHFQPATAYAQDDIKQTSSPEPTHCSPISINSSQRSSLAPQKGLLPLSTRQSSSSYSSPLPINCNQYSSAAPPPQGLSPIAEIFKEQELGKTIVGFVMPVAAAFLSPYAPTSSLVRTLVFLSLSIGFAVLWNGILLRNIFPRHANVMEQIGAALVLMAVFGLISTFLPNYLLWIPWVSFLIVLFPFFWSCYLGIRTA